MEIKEENNKKYNIIIKMCQNISVCEAHYIIELNGDVEDKIYYRHWFNWYDKGERLNKHSIVIGVESVGELTDEQYKSLDKLITELSSSRSVFLAPIIYPFNVYLGEEFISNTGIFFEYNFTEENQFTEFNSELINLKNIRRT